ncbi:hypothetical protein [Rhodanobacter sp. C05]|uniref:hypothetical protein n=1 Tax=Rhodanobacter sp. C05 TaxID=1945855 RepID=UPI0009D2B768|nr:hypothetical protein [Rhodanobacter sp. C05]OOG40364.1 hypothetical protein B0E51_11055 [Rhodanobacter sp. C05]
MSRELACDIRKILAICNQARKLMRLEPSMHLNVNAIADKKSKSHTHQLKESIAIKFEAEGYAALKRLGDGVHLVMAIGECRAIFMNF